MTTQTNCPACGSTNVTPYDSLIRPAIDCLDCRTMACDCESTWLRAELTKARAELTRVTAERDELQATFDLRWKADMRAIERWRRAFPGRELKQPDHADLCVSLMNQVVDMERDITSVTADRDELREKLIYANKQWQDYEQNYILPCFMMAERVGIDLRELVKEKAGKNCVVLLVEELIARDALQGKE